MYPPDVWVLYFLLLFCSIWNLYVLLTPLCPLFMLILFILFLVEIRIINSVCTNCTYNKCVILNMFPFLFIFSLPRKTDMERKIEIYNFSARTRQLFVRLLALVKWANSASKVDKSAVSTAEIDIMYAFVKITFVHSLLIYWLWGHCFCIYFPPVF